MNTSQMGDGPIFVDFYGVTTSHDLSLKHTCTLSDLIKEIFLEKGIPVYKMYGSSKIPTYSMVLRNIWPHRE